MGFIDGKAERDNPVSIKRPLPLVEYSKSEYTLQSIQRIIPREPALQLICFLW